MNHVMVRELNNFNISEIDSNSFVLFMYDSFGSINEIPNFRNNFKELEIKIKDLINSFKFKTLQKRFYLPLGHSIYLKYQNCNILYSPIMWVKQDISNTSNIYHAIRCCLFHLLKIKQLNKLECKTLYIISNSDLENIENNQIEKAILDFNNDISNNFNILETLDYKKNISINSSFFNLDEQAPIYLNNEFRELSNF